MTQIFNDHIRPIFNDLILPRLGNLGDGIFQAGLAAGYTAIGIGATILSLTPLDKVDGIRDRKDYTHLSRYIASSLYRGMIKFVDPDVQLNIKDLSTLSKECAFFTRNLATPIYDIAIECASKDDFWEKHVFSRAAFIGGALVATVTRTIEFVLGYFVALASFATAGQYGRINEAAFGLLGATALIHDICVSVRGLVNPQQFVPVPTLPATAPASTSASVLA